MSLLTIIGLLPLIVSILIIAIPNKNTALIKKTAFAGTTVIAIISTFLAIGFDKSDTSLQYVQSNAWIPTFNINYAVGIDGISLVLILLSTFLVPIVVLATWHESDNGRWSTKVFYVLILVLETMMIGVFQSTS